MPRSRFGISIDRELADNLERLASVLGETRSRVVEEALRMGLGDLEHVLGEEHICHGLLVARGGEPLLQGVLEEYGDHVVASLHYHLGGRCYSVVVFHGPSGVLRGVLSEARRRGVSLSFIPLH